MIPKVIHYCWFGKKKLPKEVRKCIKSWKKFCPEYKIVRWDETNFDVTQNEFIKAAYDSKCWAFVSDYARLKIIYDNGGIYLDTDVELIKSLDDIINDEKVNGYMATQAEPHVINTGLGFGATKGHQIISAMLKEYEDVVFDINKRNEFICPKLNTNPFEKLGYRYSENIVMIDDIAIYPAEYFDPINSNGYNVTEKTISIHHYSASWENGTHRLKRKIAYILGPNIEGKIKALKGR